jgi:16S rRNA (guanine(966)-N(2))-methyltransferase RsmD
MKINFGEFRGRNLKTGKNKLMRPTATIAKSVMFNYIDIDSDTTVLDIFAGTGALGIESISLGAKHVIFGDNNIESVKAIRQNLEEMKVDPKRYDVYKSDFRQTLKKAKDIDVVFVDPPFSVNKYFDEALDLILEKNVLSENGVVVLEHNIGHDIKNLAKYEIIKEKRLGGNLILVLRRKHD